MPARRFFAILNEGRKQKRQSEAARDVAACDIASIGLADSKYFEEVRKVFFDRATGVEGRGKTVLDASDPKTGDLIASMTLAASNLRA